MRLSSFFVASARRMCYIDGKQADAVGSVFSNQDQRGISVMNCPNCGLEMEHGHASFLPMQGMDMMSLTYTSDSERQKGAFRRKSHSVMLLAGLDADAYYCASCKLILPFMKER